MNGLLLESKRAEAVVTEIGRDATPVKVTRRSCDGWDITCDAVSLGRRGRIP